MQCHKPGHRVPARCVSALLAAGALLATVADHVGATSERPAVRAAEADVPAIPAALAVPAALRLRPELSAAETSALVPTVRTALPDQPEPVTGAPARHKSRAWKLGKERTQSGKRAKSRRKSHSTRHLHPNQARSVTATEVLKHLPPPVNPKAAAAVREALALLGVPYRWGGTTRAGFDCSGFTQHVWAVAGVKIPRTVRAQARAGTPIPLNTAQPGDLVVFYPSQHHVGLYVGNGLVIDSPHTGSTVRPDPVHSMPISVVVRVDA